MRFEGTQANWEDKDVNQLNDELFGSPGGFEAQLAGWQRVGARFGEVGRQLDTALRLLDQAHEGVAADAARAVLAELSRHATETGRRAQAVQAAIGEQAGYRIDALTGLPEKLPPPQAAALLNPAAVPGGLDYARAVAEFDEQTQKARQVMRTYESNTNANLAALPVFEPVASPAFPDPVPGSRAGAVDGPAAGFGAGTGAGPEDAGPGDPAGLRTVPSTPAVAAPAGAHWAQPSPPAGAPGAAAPGFGSPPMHGAVGPGGGVASASGRWVLPPDDPAPRDRPGPVVEGSAARQLGQARRSGAPAGHRGAMDPGVRRGLRPSSTPLRPGPVNPGPAALGGPPSRPAPPPAPAGPATSASAPSPVRRSDGPGAGPQPAGPASGPLSLPPPSPPSADFHGGQRHRGPGGPAAGFGRPQPPSGERLVSAASGRSDGGRDGSGADGGHLDRAVAGPGPGAGFLAPGAGFPAGQVPAAGRGHATPPGRDVVGPPSEPFRSVPPGHDSGAPEREFGGRAASDLPDRGGEPVGPPGFRAQHPDVGSPRGGFGPQARDFGPQVGGSGPGTGGFGPQGSGFGPPGGGYGDPGGAVRRTDPPGAPVQEPVNAMAEPAPVVRRGPSPGGREKSYLVEADGGMLVAPPVLGE